MGNNLSLHFDFYGIKVRVDSLEEELRTKIKKDFSYFLSSESEAALKISVFQETPPYQKIPSLPGSLYKPDSISYDDRNIRYVDYQGEALTIYDYQKEEGKIYSENKDLLHELVYLLLLSRVGERLDRKGIHRIHALGISFQGKAVLCLLPQGAGKTILGLELLKYPGIELLSDDTPLFTVSGKILPFPLRIGIKKGNRVDIPEQYLYNFNRRQYGSKVLIDIAYFKDKISTPAIPFLILVGECEFSNNPRIEKIAKFNVFFPLFRDAVFGLGLPQMLEYFLRTGIKDITDKFRIILSRISASIKILSKSQSYRFVIGRDKQKNAQVLLEFLHKQSAQAVVSRK